MALPRTIVRGLYALFHRSTTEHELHDEVAHYLESLGHRHIAIVSGPFGATDPKLL